MHLASCDLANQIPASDCDECEIRRQEREEMVKALREELIYANEYGELGYIEGLETALRLLTSKDESS